NGWSATRTRPYTCTMRSTPCAMAASKRCGRFSDEESCADEYSADEGAGNAGHVGVGRSSLSCGAELGQAAGRLESDRRGGGGGRRQGRRLCCSTRGPPHRGG